MIKSDSVSCLCDDVEIESCDDAEIKSGNISYSCEDILIKLDNISYSYKGSDEAQLTDIYMEIKKGDFILLCGKSGSGKTTITKLINGLIPHFAEGDLSGCVEINRTSTRDLRIYEISERVGSIFQNPKTQFFNLDSDSELIFGLENMGAGPDLIEKRINKTVNDLEIEHLKNKNVFRMSGGEKQLLAIASVYATSPEIYVFDKPSSNIDEDGMRILGEALRRLKAQGKTIIISEHRLYYFIDLIDRAFYIDGGRISEVFDREGIDRISDDERRILGLRSFREERLSPSIRPVSFNSDDDLILENILSY